MPSYDSTARVPFATGGKVGSKKPKVKRIILWKGKAKDWPGAKKAAEQTRNRKAEGGTAWITKKKKTNPWIQKKKKPATEEAVKANKWITKKEKPKAWITKKKKNKAMEKFQLGKGYNIGGRANLLEEMGRLDAERMHPYRRAEKHRVIGEVNKGYKHGKRVKKQHGGSAQSHYVQHGYGPHKSSGKVLKGKKVGIQIK